MKQPKTSMATIYNCLITIWLGVIPQPIIGLDRSLLIKAVATYFCDILVFENSQLQSGTQFWIFAFPRQSTSAVRLEWLVGRQSSRGKLHSPSFINLLIFVKINRNIIYCLFNWLESLVPLFNKRQDLIYTLLLISPYLWRLGAPSSSDPTTLGASPIH